MALQVIEYQWKAGHASCVVLPWEAPAAFGGGGSHLDATFIIAQTALCMRQEIPV
jgi:hypothetical protein